MSVHADPPPPIVIEPTGTNYATANQLGKGGFAICFKAERLDNGKSTGNHVALKIVKSKMEPAKLAQKFVTELQIHSKLSHPNVVAFHRAFSFTENTYVVLELCSSGSLADLLKRRKCVTMPEIRRFMIQVSGAVKYLHTRNIVHRDLKTGNLFLDDHMNIKVGDFGLAALLVSGKDMDVKRRTTMCGTPNYLAPEILEKGKGHNEKVDLWAIGIISYTLAVGKAPFHAASKEEIYKKLKSGEYSWPELSSITNDISADLRDLVSKLLVPEDLRPSPDQIVAHPFFRMAFVPQRMSRTQVTKTPTWPVQIPGPDTIQRGYSDSWFQVCKETGVGEYAPGKCFQLNGGQRIRSVVRDIEREVAAGKQPVIPIPADSVYTPFPLTSSWASSTNAALAEITEEDVPITARHLKEISNNEVQAVTGSRRMPTSDSEAKRKRDADMMPPPRRRQDLSVRKTRAEVVATSRPVAVPEPAEIVPPRRKPPASRNDRVSSDEAEQPAQRLKNEIEETPQPITSAADSTLARRPKSIRREASRQALPAADQEPITSTIRRQPSTRSTRSRQPQREEVPIYDEEAAVIASLPAQNNLTLPPPPSMTAKLPTPRTQPADTPVLPGSSPDAVLSGLKTLRMNLSTLLSSSHRSRRLPSSTPPAPLPFVSRWVDYSRKHGVGYVLEDGTVGFIASCPASSSTPLEPGFAEEKWAGVTHVASRNGERWLKRIGKKMENLDKVPLHILQDTPAGITRVKSLMVKSEAERERLRTLRVLWVKFGRYMSQSLNAGGEDSEVALGKEVVGGELGFVRFYQRMGNVGVWGFSCGALQLHFPDHTKIVLSADGVHISATLVSVPGTRAMGELNELPPGLLKDRTVLCDSTEAMLQAARAHGPSGNGVNSLIRANMVVEKLEFIVKILDQWINSGRGLGGSQDGDEKLQWDGLWVKESTKKIDWITVGRYGGDR